MRMLRELKLDASERSLTVIVGDFFAWFIEWENKVANNREFILLDIVHDNIGTTYTFRKGMIDSVVDIFVNNALM